MGSDVIGEDADNLTDAIEALTDRVARIERQLHLVMRAVSDEIDDLDPLDGEED